jgi:hypothetical protein
MPDISDDAVLELLRLVEDMSAEDRAEFEKAPKGWEDWRFAVLARMVG